MPTTVGRKFKFSGDILHIQRTMKLLTMAQLSKMLKVNKMAIHNWETGRFEPRASHVKKLCKIFSTTPQRFLVPIKPNE